MLLLPVGPGSYDPGTKDPEKSSAAQSENAIKVGFLSATEGRDGWQRDQETPFTEPYRVQVPGPGHYEKREKNSEMRAKVFSLLDGMESDVDLLSGSQSPLQLIYFARG